MVPTDHIKERIRSLNNPQLGSFGEWIFFQTALKLDWKIEPYHEDRADFLVGKRRIDVKTTAQHLDIDLPQKALYRGKKITNTSYALVEFYDHGARVSLEGEELKMISLETITTHYENWSAVPRRAVRRSKKRDKTALARIKREARNLYHESGLRARVIYRTIQAEFGDEAPHNLVPPDSEPDSLTIFLDFYDSEFSPENIRRIFAFPDEVGRDFPLDKNPRLANKKIDLLQIPERYIFGTWEEFENEYPRVLDN